VLRQCLQKPELLELHVSSKLWLLCNFLKVSMEFKAAGAAMGGLSADCLAESPSLKAARVPGKGLRAVN
jgi:hypothetical protein